MVCIVATKTKERAERKIKNVFECSNLSTSRKSNSNVLKYICMNLMVCLFYIDIICMVSMFFVVLCGR